LADLARLDEVGFRKLFAGTAIKRTGRDRFVRNVLIAIGNSRNPALATRAERLLNDKSAIVRGAAGWALGRLAAKQELAAMADERAPAEADPSVRLEWEAECIDA